MESVELPEDELPLPEDDESDCCGSGALVVSTGFVPREIFKVTVLFGSTELLSEGERQDILLILHEAATNAVKHGRAKTILFTCDPGKDGGFVLRVLNDGAPFEIDRALGPETGHYGLSGMRERALRNRLSLSWGKRGKWSYVQLGSEG